VARFLWRVERERVPGAGSAVLVQAASPGRWHQLGNAPGYLSAPANEKTVALDRLVSLDAHCRFRLRANPAVKRDGKRWGLQGEQPQLDWLSRQGTRLGFAVTGADVSLRERIRSPQGRSGTLITIDSVVFDGQLRVVDATMVRAAMLAGIGPGKGLGLGMLSLAPA
jgi:CRISPR system Cascade subunit CasE